MAALVGRDWPAACANAASAPAMSSALLSYNCTEFLETIFAANHLGAIAMPINWRLAAAELRYILEHSEARVLVCDDALPSWPTRRRGLERTRSRLHLGRPRRRLGTVRRPPRAEPVTTAGAARR